jgi:hypothetical protein
MRVDEFTAVAQRCRPALRVHCTGTSLFAHFDAPTELL